MKVKVEKSIQGRRTPKNLKDGQSILLYFLWKKLGGPRKVAGMLEIAEQHLINWRVRGKVPLEMVGQVSRKLGLNKLLFNYVQVTDFYTDGTKANPCFSWKEVVKNYSGLEDREIRLILRAKEPTF